MSRQGCKHFSQERAHKRGVNRCETNLQQGLRFTQRTRPASTTTSKTPLGVQEHRLVVTMPATGGDCSWAKRSACSHHVVNITEGGHAVKVRKLEPHHHQEILGLFHTFCSSGRECQFTEWIAQWSCTLLPFGEMGWYTVHPEWCWSPEQRKRHEVCIGSRSGAAANSFSSDGHGPRRTNCRV